MFGWFKKKQQIKEIATEAMVESLKEEAPYKVEVTETIKKPNHFPDCNCFKCVKWRNHNA